MFYKIIFIKYLAYFHADFIDSINKRNGLFEPLTGFIALLALSVLTPYLYYIPKTCLAAVIISAVIFMVEVHLVRLIWRSKSKFHFNN